MKDYYTEFLESESADPPVANPLTLPPISPQFDGNVSRIATDEERKTIISAVQEYFGAQGSHLTDDEAADAYQAKLEQVHGDMALERAFHDICEERVAELVFDGKCEEDAGQLVGSMRFLTTVLMMA